MPSETIDETIAKAQSLLQRSDVHAAADAVEILCVINRDRIYSLYDVDDELDHEDDLSDDEDYTEVSPRDEDELSAAEVNDARAGRSTDVLISISII